MTNQERILSNNALIDEAIAKANSLPDAGGGGGADTETMNAIIDGTVTEIVSDVTSVGEHALAYRNKLESISLPNVANLESYAFYGSFAPLSNPEIYLPSLVSCGTNVFQASGLASATFPKLTVVGSFMFNSCYTLKKVDLSVATAIQGAAFIDCRMLKALIIRTNAVCTLAYATVFNSTPIASGNGYIYVPAALIESYKTATNWTVYAAQFRAIEGSEYE